MDKTTQTRRDLDGAGVTTLIALMLLLAVNQVVIKLTNDGLQPVFAAGLRSACAVPVLLGWMAWRGVRIDLSRGTVLAGLLVGAVFALEFMALFYALDHTTVIRVSVIFYSMPVWMALAAHFLLPGEHLTRTKSIGLALAFAGAAWAIPSRDGAGSGGGDASLMGDIAALIAAFGWMGVSLAARITPIARLSAEMQMLWQLIVSAPLLLVIAPLFGPLLRDPALIHWASIGFQAVVIATGVFVAWFMLLKRYKAAPVASFGFLPPIIGALLGWALLNEPVTPPLIGALLLVATGILLINRRA
jgi:drug/metabolite transporter (DMT)-like permease